MPDLVDLKPEPAHSPARRCPCCDRTTLHVIVPTITEPIRPSPGFAKKGLADYKLDLLALCQFGCSYCSSNEGNYLRINRQKFRVLTQDQLGFDALPADDPHLTFRWPDIIERLEEQLARKPKRWGAAQTLVMSMLTDAFSPDLVTNGTTLRAIELVLGRTSFRIRILTKNAIVGRAPWIDLFAEHRDRFVVSLSTGTLNDEWARRVEVGTSSPSARMRSLRALQDAGVPTYGMLCPVFPDVVFMAAVPKLVDAIRPALCETVWSEPYNDRNNWRRVQETYEPGGATHKWFDEAFAGKRSEAWSRYAAALYEALRTVAERDGWLSKLVYLLYEDNLSATAVPRLRDLRGVSFQSTPGDDGLSKNVAIAIAQRATRREFGALATREGVK